MGCSGRESHGSDEGSDERISGREDGCGGTSGNGTSLGCGFFGDGPCPLRPPVTRATAEEELVTLLLLEEEEEELVVLLLDDVGGVGVTWKLDPASGRLVHVITFSFSLKLVESDGLSVTSFGNTS
jgi:hypothetical protein